MHLRGTSSEPRAAGKPWQRRASGTHEDTLQRPSVHRVLSSQSWSDVADFHITAPAKAGPVDRPFAARTQESCTSVGSSPSPSPGCRLVYHGWVYRDSGAGVASPHRLRRIGTGRPDHQRMSE